MSAGRGHVAVYRRITRLYPASFRDDYRADLVSLFAHQMEDEPALRVWLRTLRDLAISVPAQRLEPHMKRSPSAVITLLAGIAATTAATLALTIGTGPAMPIFLAVALFSVAVAVWSWQVNQPVRADDAAARSWWKVLLAGPALAALTFAAMAVPWPKAVDLGDNAYWLIVVSFMTSITLAGVGLILGVVAVTTRQRSRRAASPA